MVRGFFTSQNVCHKKTNIIFVFLQVECLDSEVFLSKLSDVNHGQETATENKLDTFPKVSGLQMLEQRSHFISIWLRLVTRSISRLGSRSQ